MVKSSLKAKEKKIKSERDEDESKQNKKWIESLEFEHLPVEDRRTNEEWWRTNLLTETSRKHFGLDFLHGNTFFTKNNWNA